MSTAMEISTSTAPIGRATRLPGSGSIVSTRPGRSAASTAGAITRSRTAHVRSFGLAFSDMDGDGRTDIISGPFWYRQPADPWQGDWEQVALGEAVDAIAAIDVDGDGRAEVIAQRGGGESAEPGVASGAAKARARGFEEHAIGDVPAASHELGSQGHALAQIVKGGQPELAVSSGAGVFYFAIPDDAAGGPGREPAFAPRPPTRGSLLPISTATACLTLRPLPATPRGRMVAQSGRWLCRLAASRTSAMSLTWSIPTAWRSPIWTATDEPTSS